METSSPAYDLTIDHTLGKLSTTVNFKGMPADENIIVVGMNIKMTRHCCQQIIDEVKSAVL